MVSKNVSGSVKLPLLPVTVTVKVPSGAVGFALIFSVELPVAVTGLGVNAAVTLEGRSEALNVTELLAPTAVTVTVSVLLDLRFTVNDDVESERVKWGCTVSARLVVWVVVPSVPLMLSK